MRALILVLCLQLFRPNKALVKVKNLGGYLLNLYLLYDLPVLNHKNETTDYTPIVEQATAPLGKDITFLIPNNVDLNEKGVYLKAEAILGITIFETRITFYPACFHVWGSSLIPYFSSMACWDYSTILDNRCLFGNPCKNKGVCNNKDNYGFYCTCKPEWTGRYCESRIANCSESKPCFNGATCIDKVCHCKEHFTGVECETFTFPSSDKIVKILNKGWFIAKLKISYEQYANETKQIVSQEKSILIGQSHTFIVPFSVVYDTPYGCILTVSAVAGKEIFSRRITQNPECYHIWGVTFYPKYNFSCEF